MSELTPEAIEAAFAAPGIAKSSKLCKVGNLIAEHPALGPRIMDVEHFGAKTVSRIMAGLGLPVSDHAIREHRRNDCCCPKGEDQ
jgi:hypothetical protein